MDDEILEQEAREYLEAEGLDEISVEMCLDSMRESGMFQIPGEWLG